MDIVEVTRRLAWGQVQCSRMCRGNYRPLVVYARSGVDPDPLLGELVSATNALAGLKWDHPNKPAAIGRRDRAGSAGQRHGAGPTPLTHATFGALPGKPRIATSASVFLASGAYPLKTAPS